MLANNEREDRTRKHLNHLSVHDIQGKPKPSASEAARLT